MNSQTYQAVKNIVASYYQGKVANDSDVVTLEDWIDKVEGN